MSNLLTSVSYESDPSDDLLGFGLGLHVAGASRLVVDWGDGTSRTVIRPGSKATYVHVDHSYAKALTGTVSIRAEAIGKASETTTLAIQAHADAPRDQRLSTRQDFNPGDPAISADGRYVMWIDEALDPHNYFYEIRLKDNTANTLKTLASYVDYDGRVYGPNITEDEKIVYWTGYKNINTNDSFEKSYFYKIDSGKVISLSNFSLDEITSDSRFAIGNTYDQGDEIGVGEGHYVLYDFQRAKSFDLGMGLFDQPGKWKGQKTPGYEQYLLKFDGSNYTIEDKQTGVVSTADPGGSSTTADGGLSVLTADTASDYPYDYRDDVYLRDNKYVTKVYSGTAEADLMLFGDADDSGYGGDGKDYLSGGAGADTLKGGTGDDTLNGGTGGDHLDGGLGADTATYSSAKAAVTVNLFRPSYNEGQAEGDTYVSIEAITGSGFGDHITGASNADQLRGGDGNDALYGGAGNDRLVGGNGKDLVQGDAGDDVLFGGAGSDTFLFTAKGFGRDTIYDFQAHGSGHDLLQISHGLATSYGALVKGQNISSVASDTVIAFGSDKIVLLGIQPGSLVSSDFTFV